MTISSIHFQKAEVEFAEKHNFRTEKKEPEYLLEKQYRKTNEYLKLNDPKELYQNQLKLRNQNHARGFAPKIKDVYWEAVVNLDEKHSLDDVKKVADFIQQKYHLQTCSIALHHDEGYTDKDGAVKYNHHAHLCFLTMNNGISTMRKIRSKELRQMQSEVAQLLGLERGKENSKATRLDHKQYRKIAKELEQKDHINQIFAQQIKDRHQDNLTLQEQKKIVEAERKKYKEEADHIASEYRALQALNKTLHTKEELDQALAALRTQYEDRLKKEADEAVRLRADDVEKINTLNSTVKQLQNENEELKNAVKVYKNQSNDYLKKYNRELDFHRELQEENKELKKEIQNIYSTVKLFYKDFDIAHPIESLKSIFQKLSVTTQKSSQNDETQVQQEKYYKVVISRQEYLLTSKDIHEWLKEYPEDKDSIAKQLSEADRREVFGEPTQAPQQKQSFFTRVRHGFER